jgi:hypothetical protein
MIGYYVHHVGHGHLSRATAIAAELADEVTGLSSLERPLSWRGDWVTLPRDNSLPASDPAPPGSRAVERDIDAGGRLHWVPLHDEGLRDRMARVAAWIAATRPTVIVSDVSVEIALLARLHGVPVVTIALPGSRDDEAHRLGFAVSSAIVSAWPAEAHGMLSGLDVDARAKHVAVGAISRFPPREDDVADAAGVEGSERRPRVLVLGGAAGGLRPETLHRARARTPDWDWDQVGGVGGRWVDDPWPLIRHADVVVTHAGQNAIAEVAAARKPAVVVPEPRPHEEQSHTAAVLTDVRWPAIVVTHAEHADWPALLSAALDQDGDGWSAWNTGSGAARAAAVIAEVAGTAEGAPVTAVAAPSDSR